jgi:hypothetical protein
MAWPGQSETSPRFKCCRRVAVLSSDGTAIEGTVAVAERMTLVDRPKLRRVIPDRYEQARRGDAAECPQIVQQSGPTRCEGPKSLPSGA